jgi:hypothetical protein
MRIGSKRIALPLRFNEARRIAAQMKSMEGGWRCRTSKLSRGRAKTNARVNRRRHRREFVREEIRKIRRGEHAARSEIRDVLGLGA